MNKLNHNLANAINLHPDQSFQVLITLKDGVNAESLSLPAYNQLMESIISVKLDAAQLTELAKNAGIESIEPDAEMGIL